MAEVRRVAIVGGGIAGLAAAHHLIESDAALGLEVFESTDRLGGKIGEVELAGRRVPTAGDNFLARRPEMIDLATSIGLGDQLHPPTASDARIFRDGALHPIPASVLGIPADLDALAASGLVSETGVARAAADLTMPPDTLDEDESVGDLVRRRLGDEVLEFVVDPLLGGINAGDSDRLSIESGVPQIGELARLGPSLVAAAAQIRAGVPADRPVFLAPHGGLMRMVERLRDVLAEVGVQVRLSAPVTELARDGDRWLVNGAVFDAVIIATPAGPAARLLEATAPTAATLLGRIDYSSVAMVLLVVPTDGVPVDTSISGILVPRSLGHVVTAVSFGSHKWPDLAAPGSTLLRVSAGRRTDARWRAMTDDALVTEVRADLETIAGISVEPAAIHVERWTSSLPQYDVGHGRVIEAIEHDLGERAPGLALAGAALRGLGLPACVASGKLAAERVSPSLR